MAQADIFSPTHIEFVTFTAAEAARITDVQPATQRNWRRRGFLSKQSGWARFNAAELAELVLRKAMSDLGMPHVEATEEMHEICIQAQAWATTLPGTIEFEPGTDNLPSPIDGPRYRFLLARPPWGENEPEFRRARDEVELLAAMNGGLSVGLSIIDLKAIASSVVEGVAGPLFLVRQGPDESEILSALHRAQDGDVEVQQALEAIEVDWRGMFEAVKS